MLKSINTRAWTARARVCPLPKSSTAAIIKGSQSHEAEVVDLVLDDGFDLSEGEGVARLHEFPGLISDLGEVLLDVEAGIRTRSRESEIRELVLELVERDELLEVGGDLLEVLQLRLEGRHEAVERGHKPALKDKDVHYF